MYPDSMWHHIPGATVGRPHDFLWISYEFTRILRWLSSWKTTDLFWVAQKKFLINYGFKIEFLSKNSAFKFDVLMKTTDLFWVAQTKLLVNYGFKIDFLSKFLRLKLYYLEIPHDFLTGCFHLICIYILHTAVCIMVGPR